MKLRTRSIMWVYWFNNHYISLFVMHFLCEFAQRGFLCPQRHYNFANAMTVFTAEHFFLCKIFSKWFATPTSNHFNSQFCKCNDRLYGRAFSTQNSLKIIGLHIPAIILIPDFANAMTIFYGIAFLMQNSQNLKRNRHIPKVVLTDGLWPSKMKSALLIFILQI